MQNARVVPADDDDDDQATEMNNSFTGEGVAAALQPLSLFAEVCPSAHFFVRVCLCVVFSVCVCPGVDACLGVTVYTCVCPGLKDTEGERQSVYMFMILSTVVRCLAVTSCLCDADSSHWEPPNTAICL